MANSFASGVTEFKQPPLKDQRWSYSQWAAYAKCPRQVKYKYVDRRPEAPRKASDRGTDIHSHCERILLGDPAAKPPSQWQPYFNELIALKATPEAAIAVDRDFRRVDWKDPKAWFRAKLDAKAVKPKKVKVVDFKTGGIYPEHDDQVELYSLVELLADPKVGLAVAELVYLDKGPSATKTSAVERHEAAELKDKWLGKIQPMFNDTIFPTKVGRHCSWCGYSKSKGGPCEFG